MEYFKKKVQRSREAIATDTTLQRTVLYGAKAARAAPSVAGQYLLQKAPIVQWLPKYNPRWLLNDTLAGITVGVLLIPQSLAYAKICTIPGEYGLMSSWLPNFMYLIMGTSKGKVLLPIIKSDTNTVYRSIDRSHIAHGSSDCGDHR
jgi:sodium-independent sulfate anion transporter 11